MPAPGLLAQGSRKLMSKLFTASIMRIMPAMNRTEAIRVA